MKKLARVRLAVGLAASLSLLLTACGNDSGNGAFYSGKSIEMVVPYAAGGGNTVTGQFLAPYLKKHIEGNPDVNLFHIEGASGVLGSNEYALKYEHDGLSLLLGAFSSTTPYLFKEEGVRYDLTDFDPLLASPAGNVVFVRSDTGVKTAKDLSNPDKPLIFAAARPSGGDLIRALSFDILDIDVTTNYGYDGRAPALVAFQQGESSLDVQTAASYLESVQPLVDSGEAVPVYTLGYVQDGEMVRDPAFPDLPHAGEVYEMLHGSPPSGPKWEAYKFLVAAGVNGSKILWVHNDAPEEALSALKDAIPAMAEDQEMLDKGEEALGGYGLIVGDELDSLVDLMLNPDPAVVDFINGFIAEENS